MFERFKAHYGPRMTSGATGNPWSAEPLLRVDGYATFMADFAGACFEGGLYRVHDAVTGPRGLAALREGFPEFAKRTVPFAYDWMGRQYALDFGRSADGEPLILLFEPGSGEVLEVPVSLVTFHEHELVDYDDEVLGLAEFRSWAAAHPEHVPLPADVCVGYNLPLFLGGAPNADNLDVSDLDVYWTLCAQLRQVSQDLPPGTSIGSVAIE